MNDVNAEIHPNLQGAMFNTADDAAETRHWGLKKNTPIW